jgi:hypothetical protein
MDAMDGCHEKNLQGYFSSLLCVNTGVTEGDTQVLSPGWKIVCDVGEQWRSLSQPLFQSLFVVDHGKQSVYFFAYHSNVQEQVQFGQENQKLS